jgi:hypothetical protein
MKVNKMKNSMARKSHSKRSNKVSIDRCPIDNRQFLHKESIVMYSNGNGTRDDSLSYVRRIISSVVLRRGKVCLSFCREWAVHSSHSSKQHLFEAHLLVRDNLQELYFFSSYRIIGSSNYLNRLDDSHFIPVSA